MMLYKIGEQVDAAISSQYAAGFRLRRRGLNQCSRESATTNATGDPATGAQV